MNNIHTFIIKLWPITAKFGDKTLEARSFKGHGQVQSGYPEEIKSYYQQTRSAITTAIPLFFFK